MTEEESRRNSRRIDLMYVSSSNPMTPDIFQLADQNKGLDEQARAQASQPLNADITGVTMPLPDSHMVTLVTQDWSNLHG